MSYAKRRLLTGMLVAVLTAIAPVYAVTYNVTSSADTGAGSLRDAIDQANAQGGGTILIKPIVGQEIHLLENLPTIESAITLVGNGVTLVGSGAYRAVMVGNGATEATLTLDGVKLGTNAVVFVNPMGHVYTLSQPVPAPVPVSPRPLPKLSDAALATAMSPAATTVDGKPVFAAKTTPVAVAAPRPKPAVISWSAHRGEWLSDVLETWSKKAGWQPSVWLLRTPDNAKIDYKIDADLSLSGDFVEAASKLFKAYTDDGADGAGTSRRDADHPMLVQIMVDQKTVIVSPVNSKAAK